MALRGIPRNYASRENPRDGVCRETSCGPRGYSQYFVSWYSMENPRDFRRQPKGLHDTDIGQWYVIISITSQTCHFVVVARCHAGPKHVSITGLGRWLTVGPAGLYGNHRHHPWGFQRVPLGYRRTVGARGDFRGNGGCPSGFRPMLVEYRG